MAADRDNEIRSLTAAVSDIVDKLTVLVHEEIELAKAEVSTGVRNLLSGTVVGIVAAVFGLFGLYFLLHAIAWLLNDLFNQWWAGYGIVAGSLFLLGGLATWIAVRKLRKGSRLKPELAIDEARKIEALLSEKPAAAEPVETVAE